MWQDDRALYSHVPHLQAISHQRIFNIQGAADEFMLLVLSRALFTLLVIISELNQFWRSLIILNLKYIQTALGVLRSMT